MNTFSIAVASAVLAVTTLAQSETSPKGYLTTEGNTYSTSTFGYYTAAYNYGTSYLQVDATNLGQPRTLKALSMRRDGSLASNTSYVARTVSFSVRLAHMDWSKVMANTPQDEATVLVTPWSTVMSDKAVSLPSLTQQPASGTAPFSALLQFDTSFTYQGNQALAFQILSSPSSDLVVNFSDYPVDSQYDGPAIAPQAYYGTGCVASGVGVPVQHNSYLVNYGSNGQTAWTLDTRKALASAPIATVLGLSNPNLAFGACEKLYAQPDITLSGVTNTSGVLYLRLSFPHKPEFVGAKVYSQSACYDAGQPTIALALSQGMRVTYPAEAVQPPVAVASQLVHWSTPVYPTNHTFYRGSATVFGLHE